MRRRIGSARVPDRTRDHVPCREGVESLVLLRSKARSGERTLAHRGVLRLDELAEFPRSVLESLRQPLEDGVVSVARVGGHALFPARFQLVGTINV